MVRVFTTFIVTGLVALTACSSSAEADKYPTTDAFCDAQAQAECDGNAAKCAATSAACTGARKAACLAFVQSAQTGTRTYQPKAAETCVDTSKSTYAKSTITPTDTDALDAVCELVFRGSQAKLGACTSDGDCADSLICDKNVCADKVEKKLGEFCGNPGEVCDSSSFCAVTGTALQCVAKKAQGETCDAKTAPCIDTLRCNTTCSPRFESGESCAANSDCAADAPYCDTYNGNKCSAGIILAPGTAICKAAFGG